MTKVSVAEECVGSLFPGNQGLRDLAFLAALSMPNRVEADAVIRRIKYKRFHVASTSDDTGTRPSKRLEFFDNLDVAIRTEVPLLHRPFVLYYLKHPGEINNLLKHHDKRMVNSVFKFLMKQLENTVRRFDLSVTSIRKAVALQKLYDIEPLLFVLLQDTNSIDTLMKFVGMFEGQTITMPKRDDIDKIIRAATSTSNKVLDNPDMLIQHSPSAAIQPLDVFVQESIRISLEATSDVEHAMQDKLSEANTDELLRVYKSLMKATNNVTTLAMEAESHVPKNSK